MNNPALITIKRIKKTSHAGHGGAWKVAYADFVTAMMAFFLLLWLISTANKEQLRGISEYFSPDVGIPFEKKTSTIDNSSNSTKKDEAKEKNVEDNPPSSEQKIIPEKDENDYFQDLEQNLKKIISQSPFSNSVVIENTPEGLSIQIIDQNTPQYFLFSPGTYDLQKPAMEVLQEIAKYLKYIPRYISISGHTTQSEDRFNPWPLSAERANVVRLFLTNNGVASNRVVSISGKANVEPLNYKNLDSISNRRIAIVLLKNSVLPYQIQNLPDLPR